MKTNNEIFERLMTNLTVLPQNNSISDERDSNVHHILYSIEKKISNCFMTGDIDGYYQLLNTLASNATPLAIGYVSEDKLRMLKYACITYGALCVRSAIEGGVPEIYAYSISDDFIRKIDKASTIAGLANAFPVLRTLISAVHDLHHTASSNEIIRECKNYICDNLHLNVTRKELANYCNVSPNYLSTLFHKGTNMTISQYILGQKMLSAKDMLITSSIAPSEIAYRLGFCSQSYFTEVFRKYHGMTPLQYRRDHRHNLYNPY